MDDAKIKSALINEFKRYNYFKPEMNDWNTTQLLVESHSPSFWKVKEKFTTVQNGDTCESCVI